MGSVSSDRKHNPTFHIQSVQYPETIQRPRFHKYNTLKPPDEGRATNSRQKTYNGIVFVPRVAASSSTPNHHNPRVYLSFLNYFFLLSPPNNHKPRGYLSVLFSSSHSHASFSFSPLSVFSLSPEKMETPAYDFDSLTDLPPLPPSDFTPSNAFTFPDHNLDFSFLDSTLSLLNRHHLSESTRLEQIFYDSTHTQLFHNDDTTTTTTPFLHLPDLKSIDAVEEPTTMKLFPSLSPPLPAAKRQKLNSTSSSTTSGSPTASNDGGIITKRRKISDKIRSLEKLMPWERKMNLAMTLEESHKYIKFLQSQIASLRWMPLESVYNTAGEVGETDLLKSLTRQQILQVLANSPGSRNVLSSRGVCVFSYEQLLSLKTMSRNL
ncbi:unnamed protein product [Arabidopsis thaliana]|nr:unnamed protein product [Arabidopsis thaliana]